MPRRNIVVVGASAGGLEALQVLVKGLPPRFPGSVFIVLHTSSESPGLLAQVLRRGAAVPVIAATDEGVIRPGHVYVAPPDRHLLLERKRMCLAGGPTENRHRPAIDPLFRSAAQAHRDAVIGVLLSGYLDDGVSGLVVIKRFGGLAIVQAPGDALVPDMPLAALENDHVDYSVPAREMPSLLAELVIGATMPTNVKKKKSLPKDLPTEKVSVFTCPECHGTLWEVDEQGLLRFRCRVGHMFNRESMLDAQSQSLDRALWAALRSLEEHAALSHRLAERAKTSKHPMAERRFAERANASRENARIIRDMLLNGGRIEGGHEEDEHPDERQLRPGAA